MIRNINITTSISRAARMLLWILCAYIALGSESLYAQNESIVTATVSKKKIAVNENISLEIVVNDDMEKFIPPVLSDFNVLAGPNQFSSMSYNNINGRSRMERKTTISYILQPLREGEAVIGPAIVIVEGKEHSTAGISISVGPAIEGQNNASSQASASSSMLNTPSNAAENIHLVATVSNSRPYIGEPVTITYRLYYRVNIGQTYLNSMPKFDGFWTQAYQESDIPRNEGQRDYYKDELYNVVTFYKTLLIPQKAGTFKISPLSVNMIAEVGTGQYDWWGEEITRASQLSINSNSLSINVRELPSAGRPADFNGAVGQYTLESTLSPSDVSAGASSTYTIKLKGEGNIPLLETPHVEFPQEIESYDPQVNKESRLGSSTMSGGIDIQYILIPRLKGSYAIPSVNFSYFNPKTGKYTTLKSGEKTLNVTGDAVVNTTATPTQNAVPTANKTDVKYLSDDIHYIQHENHLEQKNIAKWYDTWVFTILALIPLGLIPLCLAIRFLTSSIDRNSPASRAKRAASAAKKKLSRAKKALDRGDYVAFYGEMEDAMYSFILDKLKIRRSDASIENIGGRLISRGADPEIASRLIKVLESCQMARYAGFSSSTALEDYNAARIAIEDVNKSIKN